MIVAITGTIGSGKSMVARLLETMGIPVYDSDKRAKELMICDSALRTSLVKLFGDDVYLANGQLNRSYLASVAFSDANVLKGLNSAVHPRVREDFRLWSQARENELVAIESAILFETGFHNLVDSVITVWAERENCINRVVKRDSISRGQAELKMGSQMSAQEKIMLSHYSVFNDNNTPVIPQVIRIVDDLRKNNNCLKNADSKKIE